jgi:hypothetical protein
MAPTVRLRPAWVDATFAITPNFRNVETFITVSILAVPNATMAQMMTGATNRSVADGI